MAAGGDEEEKTGPDQCDQRPKIQSPVEQRQDPHLRALEFPDEDTTTQLSHPARSDQSQYAASQQCPQRWLNAEIAYGGHHVVPFVGAEHHQRENAEEGQKQAAAIQIAEGRPQIREGNTPEGDAHHPRREGHRPPRNLTSHAKPPPCENACDFQFSAGSKDRKPMPRPKVRVGQKP